MSPEQKTQHQQSEVQNPTQLSAATVGAWKIIGSVLAVFLLVQVGINWAGWLAQETVTHEKSFPLYGLESIYIRTADGQITVSGAETDHVSVVAVVTTSIGRTEHKAQVQGNVLELVGRCPFDFISTHCRIDWEVTAPRSIPIDASTRNGRVLVQGMNSSAKIHSGNGSINLIDLGGAIDTSASNGRVTGEALRSSNIEVQSGNGPVELDFAEVISGLLVHTRNGSIKIVVPDLAGSYQVRTVTRNGRETIEVRSDPKSDHVIDLQSDNGNVTVKYG